MEIYLKPIISACYVFPVLAVLFTLPYIIYEYHKYGSILVIRTGVVYTFIFYMLTSYFMTVLPLPPIDSVTPDSACMLLVPFDAVRRVVATVNITLSNPATYINLFKCGDFWQIAFNILLLVPFGVYLRYYFKRKWWQVLIMSFCYSLFVIAFGGSKSGNPCDKLTAPYLLATLVILLMTESVKFADLLLNSFMCIMSFLLSFLFGVNSVQFTLQLYSYTAYVQTFTFY